MIVKIKEKGIMEVSKQKALILSLLVVDKTITDSLFEVRSRDVHEQNSTVFKMDGLFTHLFGELGSVDRLETFGFINMNLKILHPLAYRELTSMSKLYKNIFEGKGYAVFDEKLKDFIPSTMEDGYTGYNFFLKHFTKIDFKHKNAVASRKYKIELLTKYTLKELMIDKYLVLPAGLRDYTVKENGKIFEDEINELYRKLINISQSAKMFQDDDQDFVVLNSVKVRLQKITTEIYLYIENLLGGKGGYLQSEQTKRNIIYSTRNVITSTPEIITDADDPKVGPLTSLVGIFQAAKGLFPITVFELRSRFLHDVFDPESTIARLIDPKTLQRVPVQISEKTRAKWVTDDGLEKMVNKLKQDANKISPINIDGYYLFLVYEPDDKSVFIVSDTSQLPENYDKSKVRPITYGELIYTAIAKPVTEYPAFIIRYPITGLGSIVPSLPYLKSTVKSKEVMLHFLTESVPIRLRDYPIQGTKYFNSLSISALYLKRLDADYDGDKVSFNFVLIKNSVEEVMAKLGSMSFFTAPDGELIYKAASLVNTILTKTMTR